MDEIKIRIGIGDVVKHFKRETLLELDKQRNKYLYRVIEIAEHTETGDLLIIYQALYSPFKTYARPVQMFCSRVDKQKYPHIKQTYRFEPLEVGFE